MPCHQRVNCSFFYLNVKSLCADIEDKEMENCDEVGSKDKKSIIKEGAGGEENQDMEGSNVKRKNKLKNSSVGGNSIQQSSSKKPIHSFFGNDINYLDTYSHSCFSSLYHAAVLVL